MWVDPDQRGAGVGRHLVHAVEAWGADWGASSCLLWVYETNERAIRFYERIGFTIDRAGGDAEAGASYAALAMRRPIPFRG